MPMQWNDQADARLFANVLKHHVVKLDYQQLARAMGDTLADVTPKAISHRIAKIKEKAQAHRNRWDPYVRLVASPKRVTSLKPAPIGMLNEEGDDEEGKGFMYLKSEDEQPFSANLGGVDGGGVVGGQILSIDESGGGNVGDAVVAAPDHGEGGEGGDGGDGDDGRNYLLGVDGQGHWPVPASGFEAYGMNETAKGMVGRDEAMIHPSYEAPSSYPSATIVDDDELPQNGDESGSSGDGGFCDEGAVIENNA
ncbi:unnamed protein product [Tuber aestivum]|uniref:Uncharacterized protein n=1 Tax=Tuber aestivum TaxID=59557 RepID=A0A292PTE3_9PEZI|nr:unnamed protein product [Tuber aestivum]